MVRNNREGWIGDYGAGLVGVKNTTDEATQYEDIKWLGNPYRYIILKCSMKVYLKVIGGVHVILVFLVLLLLLLKLVRRRLLRVLVLGLLRWIGVYSRAHGQNKAQL